MSKYCVMIPKVRNNNNELVDSKLFQDLLSYTNDRTLATELYMKTKTEQFKDMYDTKLDINGEPTIKSLFTETDISEYISQDKILEKLNKDIGNIDSKSNPLTYEDNLQNRKSLSSKVVSFNNNSDFNNEFVAIIIKDSEDSSLMKSEVVRRTKENIQLAKDIEFSYNLTDRLENLLNKWGIGISVLTAYDEALGVKGVADFSNIEKTAEGLISLIRLANNKEGIDALPEEFSHVVIEAVKDNPLINRLIDNIQNKQLYKEILSPEDLERYNEIYEGNEEILSREAAAKLLAKHLLNGQSIEESNPVKNLLQRVINYFKAFFSRFNPNEIRQQMYEADKDANELALSILKNEFKADVDLRNISNKREFYSVRDSNDKSKALLEEMIVNSYKRLKIYALQNPDSKYSIKGRKVAGDLSKHLENNQILKGITTYVDYALEHLKLSDTRLDLIDGESGLSLNKKAGILLEAQNFIKSFESMTSSIQEAMLADKEFFDMEKESIQELNTNYKELVNLINKLNTKYLQIATPLYQEFIAPYIGEGVEINYGVYKGDRFDLDEATYKAVRDISKWDLWLDSITDSTDYALKSLGYIYKKQNEEARLKSIEDIRTLKAHGIKLEQAGVKNTDWMIEVDSKGNQGHNFISNINYAEYYRRRKEQQEIRDKAIQENKDNQEEIDKANNAFKLWENENSDIINGVSRPSFEIYKNDEFIRMKNSSDAKDQAKMEYYNSIIEMKEKLEEAFPLSKRNTMRRIFIRKSSYQRVSKSNNPIEILKSVREDFKDQFIDRSDDIDLKEKATLFDFNNREVFNLPIFYTTKSKNEHINDYTTDVTSSMIVYADMANKYQKTSEVINMLELSRDILGNRRVTKTVDKRTLVERINIFGKKFQETYTVPGWESNIYDRYNAFMEMQVYQKTSKSSGHVGNLSINKFGGMLMFLTSIKALGINLLQGTANVMTGLVMGNIEVAGGMHFKAKDLLAADKNYFKSLPKFLGNIGNRASYDKLTLWNEQFNIIQEHERNVLGNDFYKDNWLKRHLNTSTLFMLSSGGEHWLQNRTGLAMANKKKMLDSNGNEVSLWDSFEVVPIDKNNKKLGARLEIKDGYTKLDGSEWTSEDSASFTLEVSKVNRGMHGTYNQVDKNKAQSFLLGKMLLMFRKWMRDYWNTRYRRANKNLELDEMTEGYYQPLGRYLLNVGKDLRNLEFNLITRFDELDITEKANVRKALMDIGQTIIILALINGLFDDDDKDSVFNEKTWWDSFKEYQLRRLLLETGSYNPIGIPSQGKDLLRSPSATFDVIENIVDMWELLVPSNYESIGGEDAIIQSGRYKGKSRAERAWLRSPFVPVVDNIKKASKPEDSINFFK